MPEPKVLLDRAQSAADAGESELARALLRQVVIQFPDSREADAAQATLASERIAQRALTVRVVDIDIRFGSLVVLMVKFAFAILPALFLVGGILVAAGLVVRMLGG